MMFIVSLIEFSKHVQNEISAKVMPKAQNFTADFADEMTLSKATVSRLAKQMIKARTDGMRDSGKSGIHGSVPLSARKPELTVRNTTL